MLTTDELTKIMGVSRPTALRWMRQYGCEDTETRPGRPRLLIGELAVTRIITADIEAANRLGCDRLDRLWEALGHEVQ